MLNTDLTLVASDLEHDGLTHVGVMLDGSFIPLAAVKNGQLEQMTKSPTALAVADEATSKPSRRKPAAG